MLTGRPARTGVDVVAMRRWHLRGVLAIEEAVYPRAWSRSLFAAEIDRSDRRYVVALGARPGWWWPRPVLGYAGVILTADEAHVSTVAVHPAEHRRKVGTRLVAAGRRPAAGGGGAAGGRGGRPPPTPPWAGGWVVGAGRRPPPIF
jgi:ribosomal protein S18 acetylase RimI-like enzyme